MKEEDDRLLTLQEAMDYLRVSRSTILRLIARREISSRTVVGRLRFYKKDLQKAIKTQDVKRCDTD